jgi:hypothetical protein
MKLILVLIFAATCSCAPRVVCAGELAPGVHVECTCVESCEQKQTHVELVGQFCEPHCYAFSVDGGAP